MRLVDSNGVSLETTASGTPLEAPKSTLPTSPPAGLRVSFDLSPIPTPAYENPNAFSERFDKLENRPGSAPVPNNPSRPTLKRGVASKSMTSFPKLLSRSCTSDWLTPIEMFSDSEADWSSVGGVDLYDNGEDTQSVRGVDPPISIYSQGVDAHVREPANTVLSPLGASTRSATPLSHPSTHLQRQQGRSLRQVDSREVRGRKLGRSIGSTIRQRRISVRKKSESQEDQGEGILDKLRRYSFMPLIDQTPENIRRATPTPPPSWSPLRLLLPTADRKSSGQQMPEAILNRPKSQSYRSSKSSSG
ncbi:hypothetical protein F5Y15DRAFT_416698 [Xylariaceae sp. FL0016]|nr:hypothetical protein F5Y15DRAFT_416698 [Xylariaceae sp. FL0016]